MPNKHLLELDVLTWNEYTIEDLDGYVADPSYFFDRAKETTKIVKYSQVEFKEMPTTLCTLYGSMNALASRTGQELTVAERKELCKLRMADTDYRPDFWGLTSAGVDTVRRWWNTHNPNNPIVTFAVDINSELWKKFFSKEFPIVTSVRWNSKYSADNRDWVLNATSWWKTTFWHCRMRCGMTFHDNYIVSRVWREYKYPTIEAYMESVKNWYERPVFYAMFLEKELSGDGAKLVKYMKLKCWSGERETDNITRWEAVQIAKRLNPKIEESKLWNSKEPNNKASRYEVSVIFNRAIWTPICTDLNRNQDITRKNAILMLP